MGHPRVVPAEFGNEVFRFYLNYVTGLVPQFDVALGHNGKVHPLPVPCRLPKVPATPLDAKLLSNLIQQSLIF